MIDFHVLNTELIQ